MSTAPPPPTKANSAPRANKQKAASTGTTGVVRGTVQEGERIGFFGPGGIGKTELVAGLRHVGIDPLWIDLDRGSLGLDVARASIDGELVRTFDDIRRVLHDDDLVAEFDAIVIDTFTAFEECIRQYVIDNVPHEVKSVSINRLEDYGFGKGYTHVFESALLVLGDLDALARRGKHIVLVCHQLAERVPSAESEDYLEYQPHLQSPPRTGKLRERVFSWCNHFFRVDHDRNVKKGKADVGNSRSIHTNKTTTAWAKHRTMPNGREFPAVIAYPKGGYELWEIMFGDSE